MKLEKRGKANEQNKNKKQQQKTTNYNNILQRKKYI